MRTALALCFLVVTAAFAQEQMKVLERKPLEALTEAGAWTATGGPESAVKMVADPENPQRHALQFSVLTDLQGPPGTKYPAGWPSCSYDIKPPQDWRGFNWITFRIRVDSPAKDRLFPVRFIIHTKAKTSLNKLLPALRPGKWVNARVRLDKVSDLDQVDFAHFFICEDEYPDKLAMTFTVADFQLEKSETLDNYLPPRECAAALYCGEGEQWTLLGPGTPTLPGKLKLTTGAECPLKSTDSVLWRATNVFTRNHFLGKRPLGQEVAAGATLEVPVEFPVPPQPGYYLLIANVARDGQSLCGGRVGAEDFYVRKPGETMAYTALCYRLAVADWLTDRLYGGMMTHGSIVLPHTYDPYDKATYLLWLRSWCTDCGKNTEGLEAGVTGLVFACEALRRSGDQVRLAFADKLLRDTLDYMIRGMQDPDGGVKIVTNELTQNYGDILGEMGWVSASRDSNQVGEWVRPMARAILYFRGLKGEEAYVRKLQQAAFAAADFIVRNGTDAVGERSHVLRHYQYPPYTPNAPQPLKRTLFHQEGRQCEVYVGRAMAGVSYVAYARAVCGLQVPATWLTALRETTAWAAERMAPRGGWFDYGCEDIVEGGCHTFLGNQYIGEGTMGHYLLEKTLGHPDQAAAAAAATKLAYHYVTDNCVIRGRKFGVPTEFWVGPYLYWELLEYNTYIERDPTFAEWLQGITDAYVKTGKWQAFTDRGRATVGRGTDNGSLVTSILGWLGLHYLDEIGKPWTGYESMGKAGSGR